MLLMALCVPCYGVMFVQDLRSGGGSSWQKWEKKEEKGIYLSFIYPLVQGVSETLVQYIT